MHSPGSCVDYSSLLCVVPPGDEVLLFNAYFELFERTKGHMLHKSKNYW
jgi:hypothetical protein